MIYYLRYPDMQEAIIYVFHGAFKARAGPGLQGAIHCMGISIANGAPERTINLNLHRKDLYAPQPFHR
jgi:hypothetical protein